MVYKKDIDYFIEKAIIKCYTLTPKNNLLKGGVLETYKVSDTSYDNHELTVYKFKNIELAFDNTGEVNLSLDTVVEHLNSLPQIFEEAECKRIIIKNSKDSTRAGFFDGNSVYIFNYTNKKSEILNTITHELTHVVDKAEEYNHRFSGVDDYEPLFKEDNKLYKYKDEHSGKTRTPKMFPTENSEKMYNHYSKDSFIRHNKFIEDFADSTTLYLNPVTHDKFVEDFPNRASYLQEIYGDIKFYKSTPLYQELKKEGVNL